MAVTMSFFQSRMTTSGKTHTQWTARTILPLCRTFINFPHDRDLPLSVPDAYGSTYDEVTCRSRVGHGSVFELSLPLNSGQRRAGKKVELKLAA